jgi:chromosome segregation ATPase
MMRKKKNNRAGAPDAALAPAGAADVAPEPAVAKLSSAGRRPRAGAADAQAVPADPVSSSEDTGIDRLLDTWVNLEKELGERNSELGSLRLQAAEAEDRLRANRDELAAIAGERDRLRAELDAGAAHQVEHARQATASRSQIEGLQAELAAVRRQLDEKAAGEEGLLGRRGAERRLADYRDALIGLEHTLGEREQAILEQAAAKAELTARIAELERQVAELTGRWRESDAANVRLQSMLADAVRGAERIEGDLRQAREGADQMARQVAEQAALIATLRADSSNRQAAGAAGQAERKELGEALAEERRRSAGLVAELRERDRRLAQLDTTLAQQRAETRDALEAGAAVQRALDEARHRLAAASARDASGTDEAREAETLRADLAAAREALAGRDGQIAGLASRLETLTREVAAAEDRAAQADAVSRELQQQLAREIEARDAAVGEMRQQLGADAEAQQARVRELEAELRRQSNNNAVLSRELERLKRIETDVRKLDGLMTRRAAPAADTDQRRRARLVVSLEGEHTIKYPLYKDSMIIGRAGDADIHVIGRFTSRRHARIVLLEDDSAVIEDLGSLNGIRVNDQTVTRQPLHDGDMLDIGGARLQFIDLAEREAARNSA